jgi:hypothetical protein
MKMKFIPTSGRLITALALILGLTAALPASAIPGQSSSKGDEFHYRYVSLDDACRGTDPATTFFFPIALVNSGRIYGQLYTCDDVSCLVQVAVCAQGTLTALQTGNAYAANNEGTVGGSVLIDPVNYIEQAALFRGDQVELIPPQPGEYTSFVTALNDSGMALVTSYDAAYQPTFVLYKNGGSTPLDFGPTVTSADFLHINNQGIISGTTAVLSPSFSYRGFRFDPRSGAATPLNPLPTEPHAWGVGINNRGNVLGWSFVFGALERIGVWDRSGNFKTYFVEGTPEFPTVSNTLVFNENNLIVISRVSSPASEQYKNSYLVPEPGVRLNLADLVENLPLGRNLSEIFGVNDHGDMIGSDFFWGFFLLERTGASKMH